MKRLVIALMALALSAMLGTCSAGPAPSEPDWLGILVQAAEADERRAGLIATAGWNAVEGRGHVDYDELVLLSDFLAHETDSRWLTDELRLGLGEVALNRVTSPEFPDTLAEVLPDYARELEIDCSRAEGLDRNYTELALQLLLGQRRLEPRVVYLSPRVRGPIHSVFRDLHYGSFYFCESRHPELYGDSELSAVLCRMARQITGARN